MPKDQRIRHYQTIHQHIQMLLKDPEPNVDYSKLSDDEFMKRYYSMSERKYELDRSRKVLEKIIEDGEEEYFIDLQEHLSDLCNHVKTSVIGFFRSMKKMMWEKEEDVVEKNPIFTV
ncbi:hypothetical protein B9Z55_011807 [Caenorhabditis nigoni]|uniref:Uncharacterized protein n=1 Tax=Caenorhabditis nigoni TaxID=1611254 RepID=A0A2G5ULT9_9PELO|nr:hypothetical protein B9Z55_011807 [Caenorhabditis nigoni]